MNKSKIFITVSFLFLSTVFITVLYKPEVFGNSLELSFFEYDKYYTFEGKVIEKEKKIKGIRYLIDSSLDYKILMSVPLYPEYNIGDNLEISCSLRKPEFIIDDYGNKFYYDKFLAKDDIFILCYYPRIKFIDSKNSLNIKEYFWNNLNNYLVEPSSSLAKAMLLAERRELPNELKKNFSRTGLSHIIAISGLHIAIIVFLIQIFLSSIGISRKLSFFFIIFILFSYLFLLGFPSSAFRASLMILVVLLAPFLNRNSNPIYSLILVADILVLINPYIIVYDIGFQLSFLAVFGLLFYVKYFQRVLKFIPKKFKIREVFSVTLAAQMFTWPLIVYYFHLFSFIAPISNFIILPLLPIILALSIILSIFGFIPILAKFIALPLFTLLKIIVVITNYISSIPYSYIEINSFNLLYLIISLISLIILTFILKPYED